MRDNYKRLIANTVKFLDMGELQVLEQSGRYRMVRMSEGRIDRYVSDSMTAKDFYTFLCGFETALRRVKC